MAKSRRKSDTPKGISEREIEEVSDLSTPRTPVIYEVVRRLGEQELGGRLTIGPNPDGTGTRTILTFPYQRPASPAPTEADRGREPAPVRMPA